MNNTIPSQSTQIVESSRLPLANGTASTEGTNKQHRRSRSGCFTCRLRRKKCDESRPACTACTNLCVKCEYRKPAWWATTEQRRIQKDRIKLKIRQTKALEKQGNLQDFMDKARLAYGPPVHAEHEFNNPMYLDPYDPYAPYLSTPALVQPPPYELDIEAEHQTVVSNSPYRRDSSLSNYNTLGPRRLQATLSTLPAEEDWLQGYFGINGPVADLHPNQPFSSYLQTAIPADEEDRPLLDHFIDNVVGMIFPILEVHQRGPARARAILQSLETNKSYFHCCLSVSAIHLKTSMSLKADQIDNDILRHRYEAISHLCSALGTDNDHEMILDATLAMIFFHCSVGAPDDSLPDIPWNEHFQAVSNLVDRLDLQDSNPYIMPQFSTSLTSWIDILGATMLGKTPEFSHTYRERHLNGASSGLEELMGCDDRVMYLISEIACLDALKMEGRIDDMTVCQHVSALASQLEYTEPVDPILLNPYSPSGPIRPHELTKNMTALFRIAARLYLCSLVPGFDRNQPSNINLVAAATDVLRYIPTGPYGFDRSLVWPLLMIGSSSAQSSPFRGILAERAAALGELGDFGSFGRMYRLLQEVWRLSDDPIPMTPIVADPRLCLPSPGLKRDSSSSPCIGTPLKKQHVHWRDVMHRNGWRYLLI